MSREQLSPPSQPPIDRPSPGISDATARAVEQIEDAGAAIRSVTQDVLQSASDTQLLHNAFSFAARNVETVVNSTNAAMRGAEEVTHTAVEYGQRNLQQISAMVRNLAEARTLGELVTIHRDHSMAIVEDLLDETTRLNERLTRTFGEIVDTVLKQQSDVARTARRKAA